MAFLYSTTTTSSSSGRGCSTSGSLPASRSAVVRSFDCRLAKRWAGLNPELRLRMRGLCARPAHRCARRRRRRHRGSSPSGEGCSTTEGFASQPASQRVSPLAAACRQPTKQPASQSVVSKQSSERLVVAACTEPCFCSCVCACVSEQNSCSLSDRVEVSDQRTNQSTNLHANKVTERLEERKIPLRVHTFENLEESCFYSTQIESTRIARWNTFWNPMSLKPSSHDSQRIK